MIRVCTLGIALVCLTATAASAQSPESRQFLKDALQGDNSEMRLGEMAAQRGASPGVRDFGRTLHEDHMRAKQDALQVAGRIGLPDTQAMAPEARAEARKLDHLHGHAFDREFARYMVDDHRKDVAKFKHEAQRPGPVGELAQRTLPDLERHLATARSLQR